MHLPLNQGMWRSLLFRRRNSKQEWQCTYNVTLGRIRETIVAVEKQYYIFLCVHVWMGVDARTRACSLTNPACNVLPCCHRRPLWFHHVFRYYPIKGTIFGEKLPNIKCVIWFSLRDLLKIFLILRTIKLGVVINVKTSWKAPVILVGFQ